MQLYPFRVLLAGLTIVISSTLLAADDLKALEWTWTAVEVYGGTMKDPQKLKWTI